MRIAFNLYCDGTPSTYDYEDVDEQIRETRLYSVSDLFCTEDAPYFWQAIKIRYLEYCHNDNEGTVFDVENKITGDNKGYPVV